MNKVKTIFVGSGVFAVPILEALTKLDFIDLNLVITQPDKPVGRKQILTPTAVGRFVETFRPRHLAGKQAQGDILNFEIVKPQKIKEVSSEILEKYLPDLIIVASYGQIIPKDIIDYPKYKCLNFHGSLLPLLRGAVPVPMSLLQGFEETGVVLQIMEEGMDTGPIIAVRRYSIKLEENAETLMSELAQLSVQILNEDLERWVVGEIKESPQDDSKATYCYKTDLSREKAEISFETDFEVAERMVRAFNPNPVAWIKLENGKVLRLFSASVYASSPEKSLLTRDGKRLLLNLHNGVLELHEIQLEGKERRSSKDYLFLSN